MEAQRFESATGGNQDDESEQRDIERPAIGATQPVQATIPPPDKGQQQNDPPPGGQPENIKQQIRQPGTTSPRRIIQSAALYRMRPAGIAAPVSPQCQGKKRREGDQREPA